MLQAFTKLHALVTDQVGKDEGCAPALALIGVDQDLAAAVEGLINESIRDPEVLLGVLLRLVVQLQVEVLEVAIALRVRLACNVQDVSDAGIYQLLSLVRALHRPHVDTLVDFDQADVAEVNFAGAEVHMGEAAASNIFLIAGVGLAVILLPSAELLLVKRGTAEPGVPLRLPLELGYGDSHWLLHLTVFDLLLTGILVVLFLLATFVLMHAAVLVHR